MPPEQSPSFPPLDRPELDEDHEPLTVGVQSSPLGGPWLPAVPIVRGVPDWDGFAHEDLDE